MLLHTAQDYSAWLAYQNETNSVHKELSKNYWFFAAFPPLCFSLKGNKLVQWLGAFIQWRHTSRLSHWSFAEDFHNDSNVAHTVFRRMCITKWQHQIISYNLRPCRSVGLRIFGFHVWKNSLFSLCFCFSEFWVWWKMHKSPFISFPNRTTMDGVTLFHATHFYRVSLFTQLKTQDKHFP